MKSDHSSAVRAGEDFLQAEDAQAQHYVGVCSVLLGKYKKIVIQLLQSPTQHQSSKMLKFT